jgi:hypothetical protein
MNGSRQAALGAGQTIGAGTGRRDRLGGGDSPILGMDCDRAGVVPPCFLCASSKTKRPSWFPARPLILLVEPTGIEPVTSTMPYIEALAQSPVRKSE